MNKEEAEELEEDDVDERGEGIEGGESGLEAGDRRPSGDARRERREERWAVDAPLTRRLPSLDRPPSRVLSPKDAGTWEASKRGSIEQPAHRSASCSLSFLIRSVTLRALFARSSPTSAFSPSRGGLGSRLPSSDKDEWVGRLKCNCFCFYTHSRY